MGHKSRVPATVRPGKQKARKLKKPELLAPAGSPEKLKYAIAYGADAVYLSGKKFSLRKSAGNFSLEEIDEAVQIMHKEGKRLYVAVNVFARNRDIPKISDYLKALGEISVDAIIIADPGVLSLAKEKIPEIPIHLSTQANTLNIKTVEFWKKFGVSRVSLARELSLEEIRQIDDKSKLEVEVFIHGAMCISYSGRCLLSKYLANRNANLGDCAQSCRWKYAVVEEKRDGEYYSIEEDLDGTYIFNSKDLCLLELMPQLIEVGIDSFKIEGRMKSIHYLAATTKVYRDVIDTYLESPHSFALKQEWQKELEKVSHRPYTSGFLTGDETEMETLGKSSPYSTYEFIGLVEEDSHDGLVRAKLKSNLRVEENIEILQPKGRSIAFNVVKMLDSEGLLGMKEAYSGYEVLLPTRENIEKYSILRRKKGD